MLKSTIKNNNRFYALTCFNFFRSVSSSGTRRTTLNFIVQI